MDPEPEHTEYMGLRFYRDGRVERHFKHKGWREIRNSANHSAGYNQINIGGVNLLRHRLIVAAFNPEFDINNTEHQVDHMDQNKLYNAFENLRVVTHQGNMCNRDSKGYDWVKRNKKWRSRIYYGGHCYWLGYHNTEEEARAAYLSAKEKYHVIETIC